MADLAAQVARLTERLKKIEDKEKRRSPLYRNLTLDDVLDGQQTMGQDVTNLQASSQDARGFGITEDPPEAKLMPLHTEDEAFIIPDQVEYGLVKTAPTATEVDRITLRPCDNLGNEYASAADIDVWIRDDRGDQYLEARNWTTATVLMYMPLPKTDDGVDGVLIGESTTDTGGGVAIETNVQYGFYNYTGQPVTVVVDSRNWLGRQMWYTIAFSNLEVDIGPPVAWGPVEDDSYGGHRFVRAYCCGYDSDGDIVDEVEDFALQQKATLIVDGSDAGKLKVTFDGAGLTNGCSFVITARGWARKDTTDYVVFTDP